MNVKATMLIVHTLIGIGLVFMALNQMSKNVELGGAFGSGALHTHFGRPKGLDTGGKITAWLTVAFFVTSILTAYVISL